MSNHSVVVYLRGAFGLAHQWMEATMGDVSSELAHEIPSGAPGPIGAQYLHHSSAEDGLLAMTMGHAPLFMSMDPGWSEPHPMPGDWGEWSNRVKIDLDAARRYTQAVHARTDELLAAMSDDQLYAPVDLSHLGMGEQPLAALFTLLHLNCLVHCGEIARLKGLHGLRGYPF